MLNRLVIQGFRNYREADLSLAPGVNVVLGDNGSGKTSLLEAIYLLGSGRSFRTSRLQKLVHDGSDELILYGEVQTSAGLARLGMSRSRQGITGLRHNGAQVKGLSHLARLLPVQAFHPESTQIVEGGSGERRRFLDWGLFHVEQSFLEAWRHLTLSVQQRNRLLKQQRLDRRELSVWSQQVAEVSGRIHRLRCDYLERLAPRLEQVLALLGPLPEVRLSLMAGWAQDASLLDLLEHDLERERQLGHTRHGAHRADLRMQTSMGTVRDVFSRGQIKTFSYGLLLAQLQLMVEELSLRCVILVDDLFSELDTHHARAVFSALKSLDQQLILTSLTPGALDGLDLDQARMFHVEHGTIERQD